MHDPQIRVMHASRHLASRLEAQGIDLTTIVSWFLQLLFGLLDHTEVVPREETSGPEEEEEKPEPAAGEPTPESPRADQPAPPVRQPSGRASRSGR